MEFGMFLLTGGAGFAIFAIRLLIMDNRRHSNNGYVPRHAEGNVDYVPPDYHPVYYANPDLDNPFPELWFNAVVKRGKYGHAEPFQWFIEKCEKMREEAAIAYQQRQEEAKQQFQRIRRLELSNWKWLEVPWEEWKDIFPEKQLVNA